LSAITCRPNNAASTHLCDDSLGAIVLIGSDGFLVSSRSLCCHRYGGLPFAVAISRRHTVIHHQAMAVVDEYVASRTGEGRMNVELVGQQNIGIRA
jgi:hypothetical protein